MGMLRRLRAALGIGLTWALGWGAVGGFSFTLVWLALEPYQRGRLGWADGLSTCIMATIISATLGMVAGVSFATVLGAAERKGSVDQLSVRRITLGAGIGSFGLYLAGSVALEGLTPFLSGGIAFVTGTLFGAGVFTALGATSAAVTLRLAQRASVGPAEESIVLPGNRETKSLGTS